MGTCSLPVLKGGLVFESDHEARLNPKVGES